MVKIKANKDDDDDVEVNDVLKNAHKKRIKLLLNYAKVNEIENERVKKKLNENFISIRSSKFHFIYEFICDLVYLWFIYLFSKIYFFSILIYSI